MGRHKSFDPADPLLMPMIGRPFRAGVIWLSNSWGVSPGWYGIAPLGLFAPMADGGPRTDQIPRLFRDSFRRPTGAAPYQPITIKCQAHYSWAFSGPGGWGFSHGSGGKTSDDTNVEKYTALFINSGICGGWRNHSPSKDKRCFGSLKWSQPSKLSGVCCAWPRKTCRKSYFIVDSARVSEYQDLLPRHSGRCG
jgi:hypothetical protein